MYFYLFEKQAVSLAGPSQTKLSRADPIYSCCCLYGKQETLFVKLGRDIKQELTRHRLFCVQFIFMYLNKALEYPLKTMNAGLSEVITTP